LSGAAFKGGLSGTLKVLGDSSGDSHTGMGTPRSEESMNAEVAMPSLEICEMLRPSTEDARPSFDICEMVSEAAEDPAKRAVVHLSGPGWQSPTGGHKRGCQRQRICWV